MFGWNEQLEKTFAPYAAEGWIPGRVAAEYQHVYRVYTEQGDRLAEVAGKMRHKAVGRGDYPAVGDWVALQPMDEERALVQAVLPRVSKFSRKAAGNRHDEQIVAANVDIVFLVNSLNHDFNPRRIERYLILAWESGATPVIVLTKADLCEEPNKRIAEAEAAGAGVPVLAVSALLGVGLEGLADYLRPGRTVALLGSSGAGKSSLVNALSGQELQAVQAVREGDDRGRHTTTHRELIPLPGGALLIDTPGMRELQLWHGDEGIREAFDDVETLVQACRFADCSHRNEPGCAIQAAIADGTLPPERLASYEKLGRELRHMAAKEEGKLRLLQKERWKKLSAEQHKQRGHKAGRE